MIYCVWYPSGGFGHFVNAIISLYGQGFVRPQNNLEFSNNGNSHSLRIVAPKYFQDQDYYTFVFDNDKNYSVLIDNGINNESTKFLNFFPGAKIIKICYDDQTWPIVAHTMIVKAQRSNLVTELPIDKIWNSTDLWAQREKYFLFLKDHSLRHAWKPDNVSVTFNISDLLNYNSLCNALTKLGIKMESFDDIWKQWFNANSLYIDPIIKTKEMVNGVWHNLTDPWDQAVFYYQVWCKHKVEVLHNDFEHFFKSHDEYQTWLKSVV